MPETTDATGTHAGTQTAPDSQPQVPRCDHHVAHHHDWPWLPTQTHGHLTPHPWCTHCGSIANVGGDRALSMGGLVNLLARLDKTLREHGHKITEAQKRLIVKQLQQIDAGDRFAHSLDAQHHTLTRIVAAYTGISQDALQTYTRTS